MFPSDMRKRRDWFLPLVGGAEINRLAGVLVPAYFITSRPYPIVSAENLRPAFVPTATAVRDGVFDESNQMSLGYGVTSVRIRDTFVEFAQAPENVAATYAVASIRVLTSLVGFSAPPESVRASYNFVGMSLLRGLVFYIYRPDEEVRATYNFEGVKLL